MRQFFGHANEIGLATYATFCMGTPGETEEEIAELKEQLGINIVKASKIDKRKDSENVFTL